MTESVAASATETRNFNNNSWLIFAAIFLPMLAAYFIFKTGMGMPTGTVNKGDLLLPATSVADLNLQNSNGNSGILVGEKPLWRMVLITDGECDAICMQQLYVSRQVHIRLGEKSVRVERWLLNTGADFYPPLKNHLHEEHPRLQQFRVNAEDWRQRFSETSIASDPFDGSRIYFVDQQGYAMMSYGPEHKGADLLSDIKRLLKYSYEG